MQMSAGGILPESPRRPPKMRLHIDGEGHGAVQYVQNMQNVHHVHRVISFLNKFVKVGSSGNDTGAIKQKGAVALSPIKNKTG